MPTLLETCREFPVQSFEPGDTIIGENRKDGRIWVLKSGVVDVTKRGTQINRLSSPGSLFGEIGVILDQPSGASVTALEPTEFYRIDDGAAFLRENPAALQLVSRLLAQRLRNLTDELVEIREQVEAREEGGDYLGQFDSVLQRLVDHHLDREF